MKRAESVTSLARSPVAKALELLAWIANSTDPVTLAEFSRGLDLPKPTSHRLAQILEKSGYLRKDPLTLRYSVGARFEDVALSGLRSGGAGNTRRLLMDQLAARVGARINFAALKAGKLLFVEWVESTTSLIRVDLPAGVQVPAHCSASGKLLMALGPTSLRECFLRSAPFQAYTSASITRMQDMERELARIRRRGYAEDNEEFLPGICCLAVPVRNRAGEVVAGLAMMSSAATIPIVSARRHLADMLACAEEISEDLAVGAANSSQSAPKPPVAARGVSGRGRAGGRQRAGKTTSG